jgi:hypothetical protein
VIKQANATINVTPYSVTYDAIAHTATGTATGVAGTNLNAGLTLTGTTHTNAGTYTDTWNFHDPTGNYADDTRTVSDVINKAPGSVSINNLPSGPLDGGTSTPTFNKLGDGTASVASLTLTTCTVSGGVVSFIGAGTCTLRASITAGTNYLPATGSAQSFTIDYGFAGLFSPYQPPSAGRSYKSGSAIPLIWQYTNSSGSIVPSPNAAPAVQIYGASCAGVPDTTEITVNDPGASGYQYDSTSNTWQFNWKTTGAPKGCYVIYIFSGLTGQTSQAFPIQLK